MHSVHHEQYIMPGSYPIGEHLDSTWSPGSGSELVSGGPSPWPSVDTTSATGPERVGEESGARPERDPNALELSSEHSFSLARFYGPFFSR